MRKEKGRGIRGTKNAEKLGRVRILWFLRGTRWESIKKDDHLSPRRRKIAENKDLRRGKQAARRRKKKVESR